MATERYINECKNRANANRLAKFELQNWDRAELEGIGDTFQQTYTGKNLMPNNKVTGTSNGVTFTAQNDGTYLVNGKNNSTTQNSYIYIYNSSLNLEAGKYYYITTGDANCDVTMYVTYEDNTKQYIDMYNGTSQTFNKKVVSAGIYLQVRKGTTTNYNNFKLYPMLSTTPVTANDYEPYVGGVPSPNPDYPQAIESVTGLQNVSITNANKLPYYQQASHTSNGITHYSNGDGTYTFSNGTADGYSYWDMTLDEPYTIQSGDYLQINNNKALTNAQFVLRKTSSQIAAFNCRDSANRIYSLENYVGQTISVVRTYFSSGVTTSDFEMKPMICNSSTQVPFVMHKSNTYKVNLGKNLFDSDLIIPNIISKAGRPNAFSYDSSTKELTMTNYSTDTYLPSIWGNADYKEGINIKVHPNTTYTLSFDTNQPKSTLKNAVMGLNKQTNKYGYISNGLMQENLFTFNTGKYDTITIRLGSTAEVGTVTVFSNFQLERGETQTSYSEYFPPYELNKIVDEDSIKKSTGKQLFDKNNVNVLNAYFNLQQGIISNDNTRSIYIPCKPNTTYTMQKNGSARFRIGTTDSVPIIGSPILNINSDDSASVLTITTPSNAKYLIAYIYGTFDTNPKTFDEVLNTIMLNEGSTALPYEPYGKVWYITENIGKVVLDGSENWNFTSGARERFTTNLNDIALQPFDSSASIVAISNYFLGTTWYNLYNNTSLNNALSSHNSAHQLNIRATQFNGSVDEFKTWLSTNKPELIYVLATPIYEVITNEELINQLETLYRALQDENAKNVFIDSEDLPIELDMKYFKGGVQIEDDNRFLEINQSNHLVSIELQDSSYVNNTIIGATFTPSAEVQLLNMPADTEYIGKKIIPKIGVKYAENDVEYETFDSYTIESLADEQTASNTKFTAMNGSTLLDKEYVCLLSFDEGTTHTINEFYQDALSQIGITPIDTTFDNSEIALTGNPFTNKETIRTVISEVEKTSCSIAEFDWYNKTVSLTWLSDQIDYEFNPSDYSTLEGSLTKYGPINVVILGNSQLNGENVTMTDTQSIEENGEHQIMIDSPYFLYTEELRSQAIQAIYNKLVGLTYYDLKLTTPYGKPFLKKGNKIRINTNEGQTYDTYVLSHTITFNGAIQSIIESPALTSEEQTVKNQFKSNSMKERLKRTEVIVDKTTGDITAITQQITDVVDNINENYYTIDKTNELIQNATDGLTNVFSQTGGNNIFRNTGLWFEQNNEDNPYEFWTGKTTRIKEEKASNSNAILLQNDTFSQEQLVSNGNYTVSFKYKKLIQLAETSVKINDTVIELDSMTDEEIVQTLEITAQHINVQFTSDTDGAVEIYDLMVNVGDEKAIYSQNQNETTTDTVNISKGINITSSDTDVTFKANADGIRTLDRNGNRKTEFTDTGMITTRATIEDEAEIVDLLHKRVGNHIWVNKI